MAASIKIPTVFTAEDKFSRVINKMTRGVRKFSTVGVSAVKRFDARITKTYNKLGRLSRIGVGVGAGFIALNAVEVVNNYEQSLADLSAVMNTTRKNEILLEKDSQRLGASTAKSATEVVGLQEAYARLGFPTQDILNMTEATINGSIAMNSELSETAELTGAVVKTFDKFSSIDAPDILDKMTLSTQKSALNFEKLQTALPIVGGAANAAGISFERTIALLGKLSDAGIDASSSSTALRNIFLDSASKGHTYEQILENIQKNQNKLTAANDAFGKRGAVSASILSGKLKEVDELTTSLTDNFKGVADEAAKKRLDTFGGSLTLLKSKYEGLLIGTNEQTGATNKLRKIVEFVTENMEALALTLVIVVGSFLALKAIIIANTIITGAYNIALGISTAITQNNKRALIGNTIARNAYSIAMGIGTAATWLATAATTAFGVAMTIATSPITLIILAVMAVIAVFYYWDNITAWFGKQFENFTNWISESWNKLTAFFTEFDFKALFMSIGQSILTFLLLPLKMVLTLLSKIPGKVGSLAQSGLDKIGEVTGDIGVKNEMLPSTAQASSEQIINTKNSNTLSIDIKDKGNNVSNVKSSGKDDIPINISNTVGAF